MSIELKQAAQQAVDAFDTFGDADDFASLLELTKKMRALRTAIPQAESQQPATGELEPYDAGLLNDFGGGNVEWWQDYIRAELGRAHDFYQSQIAAVKEGGAT